MAGKEITMSIVKQLLRLHLQGEGLKSTAKALGISKNTVRTYLSKVSLMKESITELLSLEDNVLESRFHAGNPAYSDQRYEVLKEKFDYYLKELKRLGVNRRLLWEEYRETTTKPYSYTQFCYHLQQYMLKKNPSMQLLHEPGQKLFVDFAGALCYYTDFNTGEQISCQVFVACMPYSDFGFVMAVPSQKSDDFFYALSRCLEYLGGVPGILVTDNLKAAVTKADRYEPDINRQFMDFANHYGMTIMPTRVAKPKDKAKVERHVGLSYTYVFARIRNEKHFSIDSLNKAILQKVIAFNQTRMQIKPYSRQECFLSDEKPLLGALPEQPYEKKIYRTYKLAANNHIYMAQDRKYYSAPYKYIGEKVDVVYTRSMVKIFAKGEQIAQHVRCYDTIKLYVTQSEHLCSSHQHYLKLSPDYYIKAASSIGENLAKLITLKFKSVEFPETVYRSCDGIFSLARRTDRDVFEKACSKAFTHGLHSYKQLANIIKYKAYLDDEADNASPLPEHANIRGKNYYDDTSINHNY